MHQQDKHNGTCKQGDLGADERMQATCMLRASSCSHCMERLELKLQASRKPQNDLASTVGESSCSTVRTFYYFFLVADLKQVPFERYTEEIKIDLLIIIRKMSCGSSAVENTNLPGWAKWSEITKLTTGWMRSATSVTKLRERDALRE